jgi:ATP-dependent Lhr-like helicase
MRSVYLADDIPAYLDATSQELLTDGREMFRSLQLEKRSLVEEERDLHAFLWRGSDANAVFGAALAMAGLSADAHDFGVTISGIGADDGTTFLHKFCTMPPFGAADVAEFVRNVRSGRFAEYVPEPMARAQWAQQNSSVVREIPAMAAAVLVR